MQEGPFYISFSPTGHFMRLNRIEDVVKVLKSSDWNYSIRWMLFIKDRKNTTDEFLCIDYSKPATDGCENDSIGRRLQ